MANHLPATGSVWAISDTANKTVTIARGMLEAATSDNISPVALICCESFGSLLPLCIETRVKVEQLARRNHTSHVFNFVKAQVGYKKDDSVEQLSRSDAGIRFLCLAAALCTLDPYDAADRLDALLEATQKEHQLRPTIRQLQIMINVLQTKLALSDYANSVAGFEVFILSELANRELGFDFRTAQVPSKTSLQDLIMAMNETGRIGEDGSIEVRLGSKYVPWTCAFIKWSLGLPPNIRLSTGRTLLNQNGALITLTIISNTHGPRKRPFSAMEKDMEVTSMRKLHTLREIIFQEDPHSKKWAWQGMVTVETWIRYQFSILFDRFPQLRTEGKLRFAVGQALYFIIKHVPDHLVLCDNYRALRASISKLDGHVEYLQQPTTPKPFLNSSTRLAITQGLIGEYIKLVHEDCDTMSTLLPANLAKLVIGGRRQCLSTVQNKLVAGISPCMVNELLEAIGTIGCALLTFTLFGPVPETYPIVKGGLEFDTSPFHHRLFPIKSSTAITSYSWPKLITTGWQALMHRKCTVLSCPPIAIFKYAAKMMGHQKIRDSTIISSKAGQALFPAFFEASDFIQEGFMQLCAFPGKLNVDNMQFDFLLDSWSDTIHTEGVSDADTEEFDSSDEEDAPVIAGNNSETGMQETAENDNLAGPSIPIVTQIETGVGTEPTQGVNESGALEEEGVEDEVEENSSAGVGEDPSVEQQTVRIEAANFVPPNFSASPRLVSSVAEAMRWKISVQDDLLKGELRLRDSDNSTIAWLLVECLARSYLTFPCQHKRSREAGELGSHFQLVSDSLGLRGPDEPRVLFNTGRHYARQLSCIEQQNYYPPTVVHVGGCIRCAMQLCLDCDARLLIS